MVVRVGGHGFESKPNVKYLGIEIDQRMHFAAHAELVAKRAVWANNHLLRILRNTRGPSQATRWLLSCVVTSRLLYEAPFCTVSINKGTFKRMTDTCRRTMLRVGMAYRTVSYDAVAVITGMPPCASTSWGKVKTVRRNGTGRRKDMA